MTSAELLSDLAERLANANTTLLKMADKKREESTATTFAGHKISVHADRIEAKAEGVRLALSYVHKAQRMAGGAA